MTDLPNEKFKQLAIRVEQETKDRFNDLAKKGGLNQTDFLICLMDNYEREKNVETIGGDDREIPGTDNRVEKTNSEPLPKSEPSGPVEGLTDRQILEHTMRTVDSYYTAFLQDPLKQHVDEKIDEILRITQSSTKAEDVFLRISEAKGNVVDIAKKSEETYREIEASVKKDIKSITEHYKRQISESAGRCDGVISKAEETCDKTLQNAAEKCEKETKDSTRRYKDFSNKICDNMKEMDKTLAKATSTTDEFEKMCRIQTKNIADACDNFERRNKENQESMNKKIKWTITANKLLCATAVVALIAGAGNIYFSVSEGAKAQEAKASYSSCMAYVQKVQVQACTIKYADPQMRTLKSTLNCPSI